MLRKLGWYALILASIFPFVVFAEIDAEIDKEVSTQDRLDIIHILQEKLAGLEEQLQVIKKKYIEEQKERHFQELAVFIMVCESNENHRAINYADALITGYPSKGLYQWQPLSFLKYGLRYGILPKGTTLKQAEKYIWNPAYNAAVAHAVIRNGEVWNWKNCYNKFLANGRAR